MSDESATVVERPAGTHADPAATALGWPDARRFEELVEGLDAIVWEMDVATGGFTYVSRRAEEMLGYPVERWLGEPGFWSNVILHPGDPERAQELRTRAARDARDHVLEYRARAADGRRSCAPAPPATMSSSTVPGQRTGAPSGCATWCGWSATSAGRRACCAG